jgi:hypothetical protein
MNKQRQQEMMRRCAGLLLLTTLGGLQACNAISGVGAIDFASCAIHFDATKSTGVVGGTGGMPFDDPCPQGQVLIGFRAGAIGKGAALSGLVAICGVVSLSNLDPHAITISPGQSLPSRGTSVFDVTSETCKAGEVVVGFDGRALTDMMSGGPFVSTISLHCAPLVIDGLPSAPTISSGTIAVLSPLGSRTANLSDPVTDIDCPEGQVGVASRGQATSVVDAFGLGCAKPVIDCAVTEEE